MSLLKDKGIEYIARYLEHQKIRIVKRDDHGPDALRCAMLPFPFIDEFDTAISQLLSGTDCERLKVTNKLLDARVKDYEQVPDTYHGSSMGMRVGSSGCYVVISCRNAGDCPRPAWSRPGTSSRTTPSRAQAWRRAVGGHEAKRPEPARVGPGLRRQSFNTFLIPLPDEGHPLLGQRPGGSQPELIHATGQRVSSAIIAFPDERT